MPLWPLALWPFSRPGSGSVEVRFSGNPDPLPLTTWSFERGRKGGLVRIEFATRPQMRRLAGRWRVLANAVHTIGRADPAFRFEGVRIYLGDGVLPGQDETMLAFARRPGMQTPLIPNTYMLKGQTLQDRAGRRPRPWDQKTDTLYFRGTSTGSSVYEENSRVALCRVAKAIPRSDCRLSRIRQVDGGFAARLAADAICGSKDPVSRLERHWLLADVDGNVSSWDRYLLIGLAGGLPLRFETSWQECWHDLLVDGVNCVEADRTTLADTVARLRADPAGCRQIAKNAATLARSALAPASLRERLRQTLIAAT